MDSKPKKSSWNSAKWSQNTHGKENVFQNNFEEQSCEIHSTRFQDATIN